jgi:tRNA-dihydrouridine synthase A
VPLADEPLAQVRAEKARAAGHHDLLHGAAFYPRVKLAPDGSHRLCVAPMMDWTDRHCRYFLRQVGSRAFLYTEMVTTGALLHGDVERHLGFRCRGASGRGTAGRERAGGAGSHCAALVEQYGYDEVNLNCGCPSERVQKGAFGACLMAEPELVADCVRAMREKLSIPVTVKHRTGIDGIEAYEFLARFVGVVSRAGCSIRSSCMPEMQS